MHINLAVVRGVMTNEPVGRSLANGDTVAQFDVATTLEGGQRTVTISVPVSWRNPSTAGLSALVVGDEVVVAGRVERRFFRSGGATLARTELVADRCMPARHSQRVRSALANLAATLDA